MPPSADEIELAFCEKFLWNRGLTAYPVQEQAIHRIIAGEHVMISVPTGTGKTLMAKAAMYAALQRGYRSIYTTPLRALTEEKYREMCDEFGAENVGFATGDYKVNREAPIQVEVAEILWSRIVGEKNSAPADVVVMDEGHYFADFERGYVWEQSIIGLDPRAQLVMLSATVGHAERFCHWVELTRRVPFGLIESRERKVPLVHQFREEPLIDTVRDLFHHGEVPAIVFVFGRQQCFEVARLLKSCRRFTTDEEKAKIEAACDEVLMQSGVAKELRPLLAHGIGIHHAGILPRYKQLVEELALERLIKFVVSTETIAAGINLPAKTVVFPSLRKFIKNEPRMVTAAEFHQMAGRAGRPQFDDRGLAVALAPEEVVKELSRELKDAAKRPAYDEAKVKKSVYNRARSDAQKRGDLIWTPESHAALVTGEPAALVSRTKITAEQVLAIGLPDLAQTALPGATQAAELAVETLPPSMRLDIVVVIDNLLLDDREKRAMHKVLAQLVDNMRAIGVLDEHGTQIAGMMIRQLFGLDGLFVYYALFHHDLGYEDLRDLVEFLVDHDVIAKQLAKKDDEKKKEWVRARLRELRVDNPQISWDDVVAQYDQEFPRQLSRVELIHQEFSGQVPHPQLHGGKRAKRVWAMMEDNGFSFVAFVDKEGLEHEEGNLFSYLIRVANFARKLYDVTSLPELETIADRVLAALARVDLRFNS